MFEQYEISSGNSDSWVRVFVNNRLYHISFPEDGLNYYSMWIKNNEWESIMEVATYEEICKYLDKKNGKKKVVKRFL